MTNKIHDRPFHELISELPRQTGGKMPARPPNLCRFRHANLPLGKTRKILFNKQQYRHALDNAESRPAAPTESRVGFTLWAKFNFTECTGAESPRPGAQKEQAGLQLEHESQSRPPSRLPGSTRRHKTLVQISVNFFGTANKRQGLRGAGVFQAGGNGKLIWRDPALNSQTNAGAWQIVNGRMIPRGEPINLQTPRARKNIRKSGSNRKLMREKKNQSEQNLQAHICNESNSRKNE
jgi:hypothetical protein